MGTELLGVRDATASEVASGAVKYVGFDADEIVAIPRPVAVEAALLPNGSASTPALRFADDQDCGIYRFGANAISVSTGGVERVRFGADGELAILSPTTPSPLRVLTFSNFNPGLNTNGGVAIYGDYGGGLVFKDGTGSFGIWCIDNGQRLQFGTGISALDVVAEITSTKIGPAGDNTVAAASSTNRYSVIYAVTGTINTSDERDKVWRGAMTAPEIAAARRIIAELGIYQWVDAVAEKGPDDARLHFGVRAQQAFAIMEDEGLDWARYAWCCRDQIGDGTGDDEPVRYGIRPDQLAFWLIAAQAAVQADIEDRLAALEGA